METTMQFGLVLGYWGTAPDKGLALTLEAERLGFDCVWVAEAYGTDAFTPLAWLAAQTKQIRLGTAVIQIPARTPAMAAMTATTLDMLSQGRLLLGVGVSGPQVVEGWHGVPYGKPLGRTREFVTIFREMVARKGPVRFEGQYYHLPYNGPDATGLGRALKLIHHPVRSHIPIYLGAMGPKNVALAAEIADGWFPHLLSPFHYQAFFREHLETGFARAGGDKAKHFDMIAQVYVTVGDDLAACRLAEKHRLALILGGYGAREKNLYVEQVSRYGYGAAARQIQELYLSGRKEEAALAIPDELVDELTLVGPRAHVARQLEAWRKAGVTRIAAWTDQIEALRMLADLAGPPK
jgi:F420-dependent oxidoreductase-like protein